MGTVRAARRQLVVTAATGALLWAAAAGVALLVVADVLAGRGWMPGAASRWVFPAAAAIAVGVLCAAVWRARHSRSLSRVALWMEEQVPALQYAAVTATDSVTVTHRHRYLDSTAALRDVPRAVRRATAVALVRALAALLIAASALVLVTSRGAARGRIAERDVSRTMDPTVATGNRLLGLRVRVQPPLYTGREPVSLADPSSVSALVGSVIEVRGDGPADGLAAAAGAAPVRVSRGTGDGGWLARLVMPAAPAVLTLRDRAFERAIVLAPVRDEPPSVLLREPARDTVYRAVPTRAIPLLASASDDIAMGSARFEVLVSSGSGEIYKTRALTVGETSAGGAVRVVLRASLSPAALALALGDVISVRAVARDRNPGPGRPTATSDTRTLRIARADEYDSVAVEGAPPPPVDSVTVNRATITNRMYVRGRAPDVVVDVASVRLKGGEKGSTSSRAAHPPADSARASQAAALLRAMALARTSRPDALVQLATIRAGALGSNAALAAALGEAMDNLRAGRDAAAPLARARAALSGAPDRVSSPHWSGW